MNILRLVARPLVALPFLVDGVDAVRHPDKHVEKFQKVTPILEKAGLPPVLASDAKMLAQVTGGVTAAAAAGLAIGKAPRLCATVLAAAAIPIAMIQNPVPLAKDSDEKAGYYRGLQRLGAALGGVLLATADREGEPSAAWKLGNWREHRTDLIEERNKTWQNAKDVFDK
ncbi:DoxX family membrane protein [Gleimia hominis]|uniref:DoxX family membrane protein n=1 Tax=Gleimia hominis TaxID=595468 RepID=A0ABU3IDP5_9ACTO|nr:DoxX family membrane protein [Gleimia hominis]MDT3767360.1 DoxX family membrane protein [Gleimia hominis]